MANNFTLDDIEKLLDSQSTQMTNEMQSRIEAHTNKMAEEIQSQLVVHSNKIATNHNNCAIRCKFTWRTTESRHT